VTHVWLALQQVPENLPRSSSDSQQFSPTEQHWPWPQETARAWPLVSQVPFSGQHAPLHIT
jgi:hypothetical protein